jgi:hypothetical protein
MWRRVIYTIIIAFWVVASLSCIRSRKEYVERNGLHSDKKPSEMAKEIGALGKGQKKAYKKQLRSTEKAVRKRNKQKVKGNYYQ